MKCDPGDLAVILPGVIPENVGRFVTVERPFGLHPQFGLLWWVKSNQPLYTAGGGWHTRGWIADVFLDPIRPPKPAPNTDTSTPIMEEQTA